MHDFAVPLKSDKEAEEKLKGDNDVYVLMNNVFIS